MIKFIFITNRKVFGNLIKKKMLPDNLSFFSLIVFFFLLVKNFVYFSRREEDV